MTCTEVSELLENTILAIEEQGFTLAVCSVLVHAAAQSA
jgi:hypothetical protein